MIGRTPSYIEKVPKNKIQIQKWTLGSVKILGDVFPYLLSSMFYAHIKCIVCMLAFQTSLTSFWSVTCAQACLILQFTTSAILIFPTRHAPSRPNLAPNDHELLPLRVTAPSQRGLVSFVVKFNNYKKRNCFMISPVLKHWANMCLFGRSRWLLAGPRALFVHLKSDPPLTMGAGV